ncbi:MAG: aldehyde dehydrogenase family protein [Candidatus Melainabacteria bacterium HGW-Melainabacteria-1]|nr:MAG: aldehyde dehydrogenase family protein [Candidatus Melainabacteria bacterium HGW-Melainabacteria-1]
MSLSEKPLSETADPVILDSAGIPAIIATQRQYFNSGKTRSLSFRQGQLQALKSAIQRHETQILAALKQDFGKSSFEAYATEVGFVLDELSYTLKHLAEWVEPEDVKTPMMHQPASSQIVYEPYGVALIIAPWNYPFQLLIAPLIGAIAAGNCAVVKPSELTPATARVIAELIRNTFDPHYVIAIEGGVEASQELLDQQFDYIFFTGGIQVGRIVMEKAAKYLTPLTLELGGKSPCIVDRGVPLEITARRIVWGKFLNAGQTCVAPDYVLVPPEMKVDLIQEMARCLKEFYGADPRQSPDYARIVNEAHFERLTRQIRPEQVAVGGQSDRTERYIAPTILSPVDWDDPLMQDELFGPLLPVLSYRSLEEVIEQIQSRPRPLALYLFSENKAHQQLVTNRLSFGGGCINDTMIHLATPYLPFGGVGTSGMGGYHGRFSFEAFSHRKALMSRPLKLDLPLRYPPYPGWKEKIVRQIMK